MPSPRELYEERRGRARSDVDSLRRRERSIGSMRLYLFIAGVALAWLAIDFALLPLALIALPVIGFIGLVVRHGRVITERQRAERREQFYDHGIARIDGTWTERGLRGEQFRDPSHPYSDDLDIFGHGSLFQLLCCARSSAGLQTLADWLRHPSHPGEVGERQQAVRELTPQNERREHLALIGDLEVSAIDPDYLVEWAARGTSPHLATARPLAAGLVAVTIATFFLQGLGAISPNVFLVALAAQGAFGAWRRHANHDVVGSLELAAAELRALTLLIAEIEGSDFESEKLRALKAVLETEGKDASAAIAELHSSIQLLDARRNMLFAPISIFFLWTSQLSMAIEGWRERYGERLPAWLHAVGEYEALCSLSAFAFERDSAAYPTINEGSTRIVARDLRHPLMTTGQCVANDVRLDSEQALLLVSGSNMSGKSTLLRTIGSNAVLAQLGAPVCAAQLEMTPLQVASSMRTQDSLLDGTSRFYAEIKRLKQIIDHAGGQPPLLFLLDEVLHGTNSHDRRIGAEAIVTALIANGAIGLVTTHDLTLAEIADDLGSRARNVHFADRLVDGEMVFDYKMHDGPVRRSNALGLMRAIGIEV